MPTAFDRLLELMRALHDESVEYVLFDGQAVNLHGIPMKKDTVRPVDHADAADLKSKFRLGDGD